MNKLCCRSYFYRKIWLMGLPMFKASLASAVYFSLNTALAAAPVYFVGGEALPAGGVANYGQIGAIEGTACGTADVFGNGPYDLFVGLRSLYPFDHFDTNNVPIYGVRMDISSPNSSGAVFEDTGTIYALVYSANTLYLRKFNKTTRAFVSFSSYTNMPFSGGLNATGFIGSDGKLHVFYTLSDGKEYYPPPGSHDVDYRPFSGSGFWRGGIGGHQLYYARFSDTSLKTLEVNQRGGPNSEDHDFLFGCSGLTLAHYGENGLSNVLFGSGKLGMFRSFNIESTGGSPGAGVSYAVDNTTAHVILRHPIINPRPVAMKNPISGFSDMIVSDTGRLWYYPLQGMWNTNSPVYGERFPILCASGKIICSALPVISPGDINGDGAIDFIVGNDAGELMFLKNTGSVGAPEFSNPVAILAGGKEFRERGGYQGSIQGPGEANWGYTCPTLFDWNLDGKLDIIMNTIRGDIKVFLQIDGRANPPTFTEPLEIFCDSLDLHLCWRTQPGVTTWGGTTVPCIIANDENDEFRRYYRWDDRNVTRGDVLRLTTGQAIRAHDTRFGGQWGRSKIVPVDWDHDGRVDLIVGTGRSAAIPGIGGIPDNLSGDDRQASVLFLRNSGSNEAPVFEYPVRMRYNGVAIGLGIHSCSPAAVDFGGGVLDLVVGEQDGTLIYYPHDKLGTSP